MTVKAKTAGDQTAVFKGPKVLTDSDAQGQRICDYITNHSAEQHTPSGDVGRLIDQADRAEQGHLEESARLELKATWHREQARRHRSIRTRLEALLEGEGGLR